MSHGRSTSGWSSNWVAPQSDDDDPAIALYPQHMQAARRAGPGVTSDTDHGYTSAASSSGSSALADTAEDDEYLNQLMRGHAQQQLHDRRRQLEEAYHKITSPRQRDHSLAKPAVFKKGSRAERGYYARSAEVEGW
ncbi:hypothetical protein JCM8097_009164 [Rhodosporidiobolus ruineniae]